MKNNIVIFKSFAKTEFSQEIWLIITIKFLLHVLKFNTIKSEQREKNDLEI